MPDLNSLRTITATEKQHSKTVCLSEESAVFFMNGHFTLSFKC